MNESGQAEGTGVSLLVPEPASAPPAVGDFEDTSGEVDEDEMGRSLSAQTALLNTYWRNSTQKDV
jgi:hypothetical protein